MTARASRVLTIPAHAVRLAALVALSLVLALAWAAPALAHDRLLEATPADGSSMLQGEIKDITLTFSSEPLKLGNKVKVTDSSGDVLFDGEPVIDGTEALVTLTSLPMPGELSVQWRVVSADGHPIDGTLTYTVTEDPAMSGNDPSAASTDSSETEESSSADQPSDPESSEPATQGEKSADPAQASPSQAPAGSQAEQAVEEASTVSTTTWVLIALAILLVIAAVVAIARKARKN